MVAGDGRGDRLQHHGLTGLGRRDDQRPLALADRHDEVEDAGGEDIRFGLEPQPFARMQRGEVVEVRPRQRLAGRHAVDRVEPHQRGRTASLLDSAAHRWSGGTRDQVAGAQPVPSHQAGGEVGVGGSGRVAAGAQEAVVAGDVDDAGDRSRRARARCAVVVVQWVLLKT
jgi:hypothetical protein